MPRTTAAGLPLFLALFLALVLLTACGEEGAPVAQNPTLSPTTTPTPTVEPTVGTYPEFEPEDYSYTLAVTCFCPDAGVPVRITVEGDRVVDAVYARSSNGRSGVRKGDPAPDFRRITIDEVIEAANDTLAARVDVEWPEGQDHPTSVYVDQDTDTVDEEVGYTLSDVVVD